MPQADDAVWVDVLPAMQKFGPALAKGAEEDAEKAGRSTGKKFGLAMTAGIAVVGAGALAAGKALYNLGSTFDDLSDGIQNTTGKSGKALDGLVNSAKNLGKRLPNSFDQIGGALAALNQTTGATGKTLEGMTSDVLEASDALGEDGVKNAKLFGQTMNQANIPASKGRTLLNELFRASQKYGVGMGDMMNNVKKFGPQMQSAGLSMSQTIDLFGKFNKAGVSANRIVPSLNAAMIKWSKAGKDPAKMLQNLAKKVANAKTQQQAMQAVSQDMSGPGASAFVTAIRKSGVSLDGLGKALKGSTKDIHKNAEDTEDFAEKWQIFKNNVMVGLEPLATAVFNAIGNGMAWIDKHGIPIIKSLAQWMGKNKTLMKAVLIVIGALSAAFVVYQGAVKVAGKVTSAFRKVQELLNGTMRLNPIGIVITALVALGVAFVVLYKKSETFRKIVQGAWSGIKKAASAVTKWFQDTAWPLMKKVFTWIGDKASWLWKNAIKPAFDQIWSITKTVFGWVKNTGWPWMKSAIDNIGSVISWLWKNMVKPYFNFIWSIAKKVFGWIKNTGVPWIKTAFNAIGTAVKWAWNNMVKPTFNAIKSGVNAVKTGFDKAKNGIKVAFDAVGSVVKRVWRGLKVDFGYVKTAVGKVKDAFVKAKNGIRNAWNGMKSFFSGLWGTIERHFKNGLNNIIGWINRFIRLVDKIPGVNIGTIPLLASGGIVGGGGGRVAVPMMASGGIFNRPTAIVGEGNPNHAEYVIPTDPKYRTRALGLYQDLGTKLMASGGVIGDVWGGIKSVAGGVKDALTGVLNLISDPVGWIRSHLGSVPGFLGGLASQIIKAIAAKAKSLFGGGTGGSPAPANVSGSVAIGKSMAAARGWTGNNWNALYNLWMGESGWRWNAENPSSGAYGIPQSLPGSKMASAGADWRTNPATQIRWGLSYIGARYGNPSVAYGDWLARSPHWYANGTAYARPGLAVVGERGAELMRLHGGERIWSHSRSKQMADGGKSVTVNMTVNNPTGEPSAVSANRVMAHGAELGWFS